jgi:hypothetical protein
MYEKMMKSNHDLKGIYIYIYIYNFIFVVIFKEEIKRGIPIFLALSQVGNYWSISWDSPLRSFLQFLEWGIIEVCRGGQVASEHTSSEIWPTPIPPLSVSLGVIFGMVDFWWWPQKSFFNIFFFFDKVLRI